MPADSKQALTNYLTAANLSQIAHKATETFQCLQSPNGLGRNRPEVSILACLGPCQDMGASPYPGTKKLISCTVTMN